MLSALVTTRRPEREARARDDLGRRRAAVEPDRGRPRRGERRRRLGDRALGVVVLTAAIAHRQLVEHARRRPRRRACGSAASAPRAGAGRAGPTPRRRSRRLGQVGDADRPVLVELLQDQTESVLLAHGAHDTRNRHVHFEHSDERSSCAVRRGSTRLQRHVSGGSSLDRLSKHRAKLRTSHDRLCAIGPPRTKECPMAAFPPCSSRLPARRRRPLGLRVAAVAAAGCSGALLAAASGLPASSERLAAGRARRGRRPVTITVSHGYTDVEATALKAQVAAVEHRAPDAEGQARLQRRQRQRAAEDRRRLHRRQLPRHRLRVRLVGRPARPAAEAGRPHRQGEGARTSNWNDFYPSERQAATVNGKVVGLPALVDNLSLVYNKKLFAAAGVAAADADWTWQDFRDAAKKLTNASTQDLRLGLRQRRQRGHRLALPGDALAGRRRPAQRGQHQAGLRLPGRAGRAAAAARHGRHRQVGLPRHGQRQLPQPVQQRQDRDAVDRALGPVQHQQRRAATA